MTEKSDCSPDRRKTCTWIKRIYNTTVHITLTPGGSRSMNTDGKVGYEEF